MVDGRLTQQWEHVSHLMATMYNSQPGRKSAVKAHKVNPWRGLHPKADDGDVNLDDIFGLGDD